MGKVVVKTPADLKKELKKRLEKVLKALPDYWISAFVHVNPEYSQKKTHLSNVSRGLSVDENVIEKMEELAERLNPKNK